MSLQLVSLALLLPLVTHAQSSDDWDLVVFGATPAGFAASLAAKEVDPSLRVLLLEPSGYVGGMASPGGIGLRDCELNQIRTNNSTQHRWAMRNAEFYNYTSPVWQPDNWVGERSFLSMLEEAGVELLLRTTFVEGAAGVRVDNDGRLRAIALEGPSDMDWISGKYWVDASYEGELAVAAGATTTYGREPRSQYNESFGGITAGSAGQFSPLISPLVHPGSNSNQLIEFVYSGPDPALRVGEGDGHLMAFSYRACLSTTNFVPITPPQGYDPDDFELARRYLLAQLATNQTPSEPWGNLAYKDGGLNLPKTDACCGFGPVGIDAPGLEVGYATGSRATRAEIAQRIKYWVQGLLWFYTNDTSVPLEIREAHRKNGYCADEWPENSNFPPQLYVREARRLVGDKVFSQNDRVAGCTADSVGLGAWGFDIHEMQRVAVLRGSNSSGNLRGGSDEKEWVVWNEGLTSPGQGGTVIFELPFSIILPKRSELVNLAAPNIPSVSHVAFAAVREEPTLWNLGAAAGAAVGLNLMRNKSGIVPLHEVELGSLQETLIAQGGYVHWPPRANCSVHPALACAAADASAIMVGGAGSAVANGVYKLTDRTEDGLPVFAKAGEGALSLYSYEGAWRIGEFGRNLFYEADAEYDVGPPAANSSRWRAVGDGEDPPPSEIACTLK
eukprot:TRINITY_DN2640_c0_g1_i1.p1 TRINITY_DN2640_c0_g1~~TRINITY_DN2640_c0_g1_i1.p1  ORF type:complete len:672 (-),score=119.62 TRINITY_DN2640_c0_g1_i1:322-2337(-)